MEGLVISNLLEYFEDGLYQIQQSYNFRNNDVQYLQRQVNKGGNVI